MKAQLNKDSKIVIIGGGPAGSHMAYELNKIGYKNLTIFEKNNRIGGKSYSINYDNVIHEMGTCYLSASYTKVLDLMRELGDDNYINIPAELRQAWTDDGCITTQQYVSEKIWQTYKVLPSNKKQHFLSKIILNLPYLGTLVRKLHMRGDILNQISDYIAYCNEIYTDTNYSIPHLVGTKLVKSWPNSMEGLLKEKNAHLLQLIFFMMNSVMCYGYPSTNSPYYGLYWMSKEYLDAYAKFILRKPANINSAMLPGGFQQLWEKTAAAAGAQIKFDSNVAQIKRENGKIRVYKDLDNHEEFDFLISAIPTPEMLKLLDVPTEEEKRLFSCLTYSIAVTTLVVLDSPYKNSGILYWFDNLVKENQDKVFASRTAAAILQKRFDNIQTSVAYQYYDDHKTFDEAKSEKHFIDSFKQANIKIKNIITREIWPYFYRYKHEDVALGLPFDIDKIQGENNTLYIGSSVCFESVNAVVNFNHYVIDKFLN